MRHAELTDVEASIGENVSLSCQSASPAPIAWLFVEFSNSVNGTYLYRNGKATMTKTSWEFSSQSAGDYSIVLKGVKLDESGYYVCYEEGGKTNKGYKLNITGMTSCLYVKLCKTKAGKRRYSESYCGLTG